MLRQALQGHQMAVLSRQNILKLKTNSTKATTRGSFGAWLVISALIGANSWFPFS